MTIDGLAKLREPFKPNQIGKLPKPMKKEDQDKGRCEQGSNSRYSADGHFCGGWHARSIHLDYVGHAAITDRFLDADPEWSWEPVAFDADGLPKFDKLGGIWIKLTICGMTRLGYGDAQGKTGPNAIKEAIGDALRNAGLRFGAALDLWHKGELHDPETVATTGTTPEASEPIVDQIGELKRQVVAAGRQLGLRAADLSDQFAADNGGLPVANATLDELTRFLQALNDQITAKANQSALPIEGLPVEDVPE